MEPLIAAALIGAASQTGATLNQATMPRRQYKWNKRAAEDANRMNRENQQWLLEQQLNIQREQRAYDSPQAQMQRYIEAGLNPNLIYGNGSSAGSAFPIDAGSVAPVRIDPPGAANIDVGGGIIRSTQALLDAHLKDAKIGETLMREQYLAIQGEIAKTNPMLDPKVAESVYREISATATLKAGEAQVWMKPDQSGVNKVLRKVEAQVSEMENRLGLQTTDQQIRNRILESKEFENAIKEINLKWLQDSEMTPEHIRQGLMLILQRML